MEKLNCILKHKDISVAIIRLEIDYGVIDYAKILEPEHLPISVRDTASLSAWWQKRAVPETQDFLKEQLELLSINNHRILTKNLGLSLNDCYWICPVQIELTWKEVSLYQNPFREELSLTATGSEIDIDNETEFFAGSSLQGNLKKKWIRQNSQTYLVKGNYKTSQQSLNEVFATLLHQKQANSIPYVSYKLAKITFDDEPEIGCISPNFTSENAEFFTAREVMKHFGRLHPDYLTIDQIAQTYIELGVSEEEAYSFLEYQALSDFVLTNEDRHLQNYGILRNPNTLEIIGVAPIFDTGNSMFWEKNFPNEIDGYRNIRINRAERTEYNMLKAVKNFSRISIDKLPTEENMYQIYQNHNLSEEHISKIAEAYRIKIRLMEEF